VSYASKILDASSIFKIPSEAIHDSKFLEKNTKKVVNKMARANSQIRRDISGKR
jgi:hypothetical protein